MKRLPQKTKFFYAIGNLGYGTIAQTVNNFVMFFGTSVLGISGTLVGLAVALSTFWDGISDPIVGYLSDHTKSKTFGKRLGYMTIATLGLAVFNVLLWIIPVNISMFAKFIWMLISLLCIETFATFFATPYTALGIDLAPDYNEQSSLQGFKTVFFIVGMIMPSLLMMIFMPSTNEITQSQFLQGGYIKISYITTILCLICGTACILGTFKNAHKVETKIIVTKEKNVFFKIFVNFFQTLKNDNFGPIIIGYSISLISSAFLTSVGLHLFTYSFHFSGTQISFLMSSLFIGAIISQAFWIYLSKRTSKNNALSKSFVITLIGIALTATLFIFRDLLSNTVLFWAVLPCIFLCGFGTGALYSIPISMFADCITLDKLKTGENHSATYSGFMTLAFNIANSIALLVIGVLLDIIKFNSAEPVQPQKVQNWLGVIVFVGCALSIALAKFVFSKYKLTRSELLKEQLCAERKQEKINP
ncbi:MAG: MFS transporter [Clostridia bacterium]